MLISKYFFNMKLYLLDDISWYLVVGYRGFILTTSLEPGDPFELVVKSSRRPSKTRPKPRMFPCSEKYLVAVLVVLHRNIWSRDSPLRPPNALLSYDLSTHQSENPLHFKLLWIGRNDDALYLRAVIPLNFVFRSDPQSIGDLNILLLWYSRYTRITSGWAMRPLSVSWIE